MDQQTLLIILTIFVALAALAMLIQMGTLIGLFLVAKKLQQQVTDLMPQVNAIIGVGKKTADVTLRTVETAEKHIDRIGATSGAILDVTKQQVAKIDDLLSDATTRAKVQLERAEMVLDDSMGKAQETVSIVQRTILRPVRELNGVVTGIRTSLAHLSRGGRPTVDHATSDEEMFI
jgi:hypothetical protein